MIFFFRKKKLVLDCFTNCNHAYEYAPIQAATKYLPDWWKKLPKHGGLNKNLFTEINMKSCYGLIDLYRSGVMFPLWSDIRIEVAPDGGIFYQYADLISSADFHSPDQYQGFAPSSSFTHIKLLSPWRFSCKEDIRWLYMPPMYNQDSLTSYLLCVGAVSFKYQHATNINLLFPLPDKKKLIQIDHGQPMAHIVPMSDKLVEIKNHLVSSLELERLASKQKSIVFERKYEKLLRLQKAKCPFS